jgi:hypothetical protein
LGLLDRDVKAALDAAAGERELTTEERQKLLAALA